MTTTIVPVVPGHAAFDQVAVLFDAYRVHYGQPSALARTGSWLREQVAQHGLAVAAAIRGDQVGGFVTVATMPASLMLGTAWSIRDLYVTPHHRRTGIASALLRHTITGARAAGALRVSLQTETDNVPALKLYTAIGFRPVGGLELLNLSFAP
ncbi:GNAT family N-acetyltransferase [Actinoplanes couchii]|uniref:N-acetyltransferase domain-containing protein n=1 Tax=Actinoplanes couchii TaxID=403638 RepID=A0ABQ3XNZ2_9ACTN|nr:GNAT family N-acetyltransferase [Actinoplanes couchii]MDR6319660.1 ribosomal protein S18 acetylase RimI-like enzyme [Actinoplanes couchii]GID60120.1 hypothetical protein Aco03nite_085240 [Actinoplanes couchii]